ncbi:hypothetical protein [Pedobacter jamesrossensis]
MQKDILAKLITLEMGKLLAQSYGEITLCADILNYDVNNAETFLENLLFGTRLWGACLYASRPWHFFG